MIIRYATSFKKQYRKLPPKLQRQFKERLRHWTIDPTDPQLRVHPLKGKYAGYWSLNVSGDLRALYVLRGEHAVLFMLIGTHSKLSLVDEAI